MALATSQDVVNEALSLIGYDGAAVSAPGPNFDSSTPGQVAQRTYPYAVQAVGRLSTWSWARTVAPLTTTGNTAPFPWAFEYGFPVNGIDIWQLMPASASDLNNPVPIAWVRGISLINNVMSSVIWANLVNAFVVYNGAGLEQVWDPLFRETVVSYLAAVFGMSNLGKPDMAEFYMEKWKSLIPAASERTDQ